MPAPATLTLRQINRATLARQMLLARDETNALSAIERLVALQAQVPRPPFVGLWSRVAGFRREALVRLYEQRKVVRGTSLRCTIHLMMAKDFVALRQAIQPALTRIMNGLVRSNLDARGALRAIEVTKAFFEEEPRTFDELRKHVTIAMPGSDPRAVAYVARTQVPLVQVPSDARWSFGGVADFTTAETWLRRPISCEAASPSALVLRYLAAFGPATAADAQTWSSLEKLTPTFEELRPKLRVFRDERGKELFDLPRAPRPSEETEAPVRFLPEYDNLLLSHAERSRVLPLAYKPYLQTPNGLLPGTILIDGFVAASWSITRAKAKAVLDVQPFAPLSKKATQAIEAEGESLLRFVEDDADDFRVRFAKSK